MTIEGSGHQLDPLPDDLVGRAVKDKKFRTEILKVKESRGDIKGHLKKKGFVVSDEAVAVIEGMDIASVDRALAEIDAAGPDRTEIAAA